MDLDYDFDPSGPSACEPLFDLVGIDMDYLILDCLAGVFGISIFSENVLVKNIISFCQKLLCGYEVASVGVIFVKIHLVFPMASER